MIRVTNPAAYATSLRLLGAHRANLSRDFRGRFIQLFLGLKYYQNEIPSMFANQFVSTETLQTLLDDLYAKGSRPLDDCVLMLFNNGYKPRTGLTGQGRRAPQNTWRNNFHLQKGVGCYAPPQDLSSAVFLNQSRVRCRYLQPAQSGALANATCRLCPRGARYRNEDHRKWLRIDPGGAGFAVVDLLNTDNFIPYIAPNGNRIPILPLIIALYHDALPGLALASRQELDVDDFADDFNFSPQEVVAYFDGDPAHPGNQSLLRTFADMSYRDLGSGMVLPRARRRALALTACPRVRVLAPTLSGTPAPPPGVNTGWEAEQFVMSALIQAQCTVFNVSRQRLGYDLLIKRGQRTWYVDVKSSLGYCSPSLTQREWEQARAHGDAYVLAIIENFNPVASNTIYWIPDPFGTCTARESSTVSYGIARTSWVVHAVSLNSIWR